MPEKTPSSPDAPEPTSAASESLSNAELVQLRVRVVALENLVISLLAAAPAMPTLANKMALHISPRQGFTEHPLTVHAAGLMNHLIHRADYFRDVAACPGELSPD